MTTLPKGCGTNPNESRITMKFNISPEGNMPRVCDMPIGWLGLCLLVSALSFFTTAQADESLCASVKIEIAQELTLERQGFDAHMRINNGLVNIPLEDISIIVNFADEEGQPVIATTDPNASDALFFIRIDSMDHISDISGNGTVRPSTTADIHWLIIPAPGASNGNPRGSLYYVGATISYMVGGQEEDIEVAPDYIFVKPMPELAIDYFLPDQVYGDDAFTGEIEPPVPFSLGVRAKNNGSGTARDFKIDSARPKIVDNDQGLLIGFQIQGSEVNGQPATPNLAVNLGDILPDRCGVARWIMTCSLSGKFVDFIADFSHADELGGELTSLIENMSTHLLIHDVLVDAPGRDTIRDFLTQEGDSAFTVYESDGIDTAVTDHSSLANLTAAGQEGHYSLTTPATAGFMYVRIPDPFSGGKVITEIIRSDGKRIKAENMWLSKTRVKDNPWQHFFNLFDFNTPGTYTVVFSDQPVEPHAPVLQFVPDRQGVEGQQISFVVEASDADGTTPSLSAAPLPAGAVFTDGGNGEGTFDWTPEVGQAGEYPITFSASDGSLDDSKFMVLQICPTWDTDCDGMDDDWERTYFGNLDRDGGGDSDGDGISDLNEYRNGTDPLTGENAPSVPEIFSPAAGAEIIQVQPDLVITNSTDPDGDTVTYIFEIYDDEAFTHLLMSTSGVTEGPGTTSLSLPSSLEDNHRYYWRVRATDGDAFSQWAYGNFFVNTENDPPGAFLISSPADGKAVDTLTPVLSVTNSTDVDGDAMVYTFEVYSDDAMTTVIVSSDPAVSQADAGCTSWTVTTTLEDNTTYYWHVVAMDEHGATTETALSSFRTDTANHAPDPPQISAPAQDVEVQAVALDLVVDNASDSDGDNLVYIFQIDKANTFDSPDRMTSGEIPEGTETTAWEVSNLDDNTKYYWRVKADDGMSESPWATGSFFVNTINDDPDTPTIRNPDMHSWVNALQPVLSVNPSSDPDKDSLLYRFEIYKNYEDGTLEGMVAQGESSSTLWTLPEELNNATRYYWRAQSQDEHGITSAWTDPVPIFIKTVTADEPPHITLSEPSSDLVINMTGPASVSIGWDDEDPDSNAQIALYYDADDSGADGTLIIDGLEEDADGSSDTYVWDTRHLEDGAYYVYALITDAESSETSYAPGAVVIDRTPPIVDASPAGGYQSAPQNVTLSANEAVDIYYTTDGSDPTVNATLYDSPIFIDQETELKFMAVDRAGNPSDIREEIYTFNRAPFQPSQPEPASGTTDIPTQISLRWTGGDPDQGDTVTYDLYLDKNDPPVEKVLDHASETVFSASSLDYGSLYFWKVVCRDNNGVETAGPVWHFTTFAYDGDADGDGLNNGDEMAAGTDPFNWDTDRDGYGDGEEVGVGTDPLNRNVRPPYSPGFGDLDGDGDIDAMDLALFSSAMGSNEGEAAYLPTADFNNDGVVDKADLDLFCRVFGYTFHPAYDPSADFDQDGDVDAADLSMLVSAFGSQEADPASAYDATIDLNGDGQIDRWDLALFSMAYGFPAD